jgi:hypothetical protein
VRNRFQAFAFYKYARNSCAATHGRRSNQAAAAGLADMSLLALPAPGDDMRGA